MRQEGAIDAWGLCSALNYAKTVLGYPVVLRVAGRRRFSSDATTATHIRGRLPNEIGTVIGTDYFFISMIPHTTSQLLEFRAGVGSLLCEEYPGVASKVITHDHDVVVSTNGSYSFLPTEIGRHLLPLSAPIYPRKVTRTTSRYLEKMHHARVHGRIGRHSCQILRGEKYRGQGLHSLPLRIFHGEQ